MTATESEQASGAGKTFLSSSEVVERLGISKSTLYAYVSRGLIRSEPDPDSPRSRRYRADDVERLLNRQRIRLDPGTGTVREPERETPIVESGISSIDNGRLSYRDHDAIDLASREAFESVVSLLWGHGLGAPIPSVDRSSSAARNELLQQTQLMAQSLDAPARVQMLLPVLEQRDRSSFDLRPDSVEQVGVNILQLFTAAMVGAEGRSGIAKTLQAHWAPGRPGMARLIDAALVLSADHEVDVSALTVRCIASSRAPLYSAIAGGLSAIRGQKQGGAILQAGAMVAQVDAPDNAYDVLRNRLQRGENLAGFGNERFPDGDPRAEILLQMLREELGDAPEITLADSICAAANQLQGLKPNLDFGLVLLTRSLGESDETARALMVLGRIAGWVAHALEEYQRDEVIEQRTRSAMNGSAAGA